MFFLQPPASGLRPAAVNLNSKKGPPMKLRTTSSYEGFPVTVGDATIIVNPMSSSALSRLRQKHTTINRGVEKINGSAMTCDMFDRVVLSWSGINSEDGCPLACTSENKRLVYEHNSDFAADVLKEMEAVAAERRLGEEGNSQPGPSGTSVQAEE